MRKLLATSDYGSERFRLLRGIADARGWLLAVGGSRASAPARGLRPEADATCAATGRTTPTRCWPSSEIRAEPWVREISREQDGVRLRLSDSWIEMTGAALEAGGSAEAPLADLAAGRRYSVQFWDANATKALHVGHLRNLAIGNALAAALAQAGAQVERRSRISDMGRAWARRWRASCRAAARRRASPRGDEKSDHFVGACYADYVAAGGGAAAEGLEQAEDSLSREVHVQDDAADDADQARARRRARGARAVVQDTRVGDRRAAQDARAAGHRLRPGPVRV